jgi:hypothetical protein
VGSVQVVEGDSGSVSAHVSFTLSRPAHEQVIVDFATAGVSASAGVDFVERSGQVVIPAGETDVTEAFAVVGDDVNEADETFTVTASSTTGAVLGDPAGTVTITDDDPAPVPPPTMWVVDTSVTEGNSGTKKALLTVRLSRASQRAVTVGYATVAGTARPASDYTARSGTLRIPAGTTSGVVAVDVLGDRRRETRERFRLSLSSVAGATLTDSAAVVTVRDND